MTAKNDRWPLYVNDEGVVTCDKPFCPDENFLEGMPYRRVDWNTFRYRFHNHAALPHTQEARKAAAQKEAQDATSESGNE